MATSPILSPDRTRVPKLLAKKKELELTHKVRSSAIGFFGLLNFCYCCPCRVILGCYKCCVDTDPDMQEHPNPPKSYCELFVNILLPSFPWETAQTENFYLLPPEREVLDDVKDQLARIELIQ